MSVVGGQPKNTQIPVTKEQNTSNTIKSLIITSIYFITETGRSALRDFH